MRNTALVAIFVGLLQITPAPAGDSRLATLAIDLMWDAEPLTWWQRLTTARTEQTCPEPGFCFRRDLRLHCSALKGVPECYHTLDACALVTLNEQSDARTVLTDINWTLTIDRDLRALTFALPPGGEDYKTIVTPCIKEIALRHSKGMETPLISAEGKRH